MHWMCLCQMWGTKGLTCCAFSNIQIAWLICYLLTYATFILCCRYVVEYANLVNAIKIQHVDLCSTDNSPPMLSWSIFLENHAVSDDLRNVILRATSIPMGTASGISKLLTVINFTFHSLSKNYNNLQTHDMSFNWFRFNFQSSVHFPHSTSSRTSVKCCSKKKVWRLRCEFGKIRTKINWLRDW